VAWAHTLVIVLRGFASASDQVGQLLSLYTQSSQFWLQSARKSSGLGTLVISERSTCALYS